MTAGARFVRADLHVHSLPDDGSPSDPPADYVQAALTNDVSILAITDHNSIRNVESFIDAARDSTLFLVPGVELSTDQGHLLILWNQEDLPGLQEFTLPQRLGLKTDPKTGDVRVERSILDLLRDLDGVTNALPILAHVDVAGGFTTRATTAEMCRILGHHSLAGIEFQDAANLTWFSPSDQDAARRRAWEERCTDEELEARGIARLVSSDAHCAADVGTDRSRRTITRLRMDELNWTALRNAILLSPRARCKPEPPLPPTYARIETLELEGGFLNGTKIELSPNLTCFIGGRGSGKSTALLAMRAALGADISAEGEDPDDPERMPDRIRITFSDRLGNRRVAVRERGASPIDEATGTEIFLPLSDMGQDRGGETMRAYATDPLALLGYLDQFCDLEADWVAEANVLQQLQDNGTEVLRTVPDEALGVRLLRELKEMQTSLDAAKTGNIEGVARYAEILGTQGPLLEELKGAIERFIEADSPSLTINLASLASRSGADLTQRPAADFVGGDEGIEALLESFRRDTLEAHESTRSSVRRMSANLMKRIDEWFTRHEEWTRVLERRRHELKQQGLAVQAGELERIAKRMSAIRRQLSQLAERRKQHQQHLRERKAMLQEWSNLKGRILARRRVTLGRIAQEANAETVDLDVHVTYREGGHRLEWQKWLGTHFGFRTPRVERVASAVTPLELAEILWRKDWDELRAIHIEGERFFNDYDEAWLDELASDHERILNLQVLRLNDLPRIDVGVSAARERQRFEHLSAGQQRSVLLSLILCGSTNDPLVLDQPEDHLDASFIARGVVRQLERIKESRQVILATHNANLTVLGDAELVVPMYASAGRGQPHGVGAVDRVETRTHVCSILEGGEEAYRRRGRRYGIA